MDETPAQQPAPGPTGPGATGDPGPTGPDPTSAGPTGPDPYAPYGAPPPGGAPRSGADTFFDSIRRAGVVRSDERWVGGVSGGLALRLGIDPLVVRGLFGIATLLGGVGLVLYGIGWLLLPEQRDGRIHLQQLFRGDFDAAVIGGFAAILVGIGVPDAMFMPWWGGDHGGWWRGLAGVAALVVIIAVVASTAGRSRGSSGPTTALPRTPPYGQYPPYAQYAPYAPYGPPPAPTGAPPTDPTPPPGAPRRPPAGSATPAVVRHHPEGTSMSTAPPATPAPQGYGPGPAYPGQGPAYLPPRPPYPPVPPGPRVALPAPPRPTGPGIRPVGLVVALSLLVWAGLLYAERIGRFDEPVLLTAAAVLVILAGLGIAIAGVLGRTSGGLGALAVLTLIVVVPIGAASNASWSNGTFVGDMRYHPTDAATAAEGYSVFAGDVVIDLTDVPTTGDVVEVPVHLGAGELRVILPEDGAYTARVRQTAGEFTWLGEATVSGVRSGWRTYESPAVADGADPELALEISVGAGTLQVEED